MKKPAAAPILAALLSITAAADDASSELERARKATATFAGALKSELMSAMQAGGAVSAIEVCRKRAPVIAGEVSAEYGMTLSRVSLRNRNPGNAPDEWQGVILRQFEEARGAGENAADLSWHAVAETPGGREFRFMKAISTGGPCLQCHGTDITPEVAERLSELYPEDRARGYQAGDIRGAFVVTHRLEP